MLDHEQLAERQRIVGIIHYVIDDMRRFGEPLTRMFMLLGAITGGYTRTELQELERPEAPHNPDDHEQYAELCDHSLCRLRMRLRQGRSSNRPQEGEAGK